ncbi:MAG: hypothetical protein EOO17_00550 [Chloroflexi bacterium]|nr:MAG: hypothetical protein EOO17_00550 [Chloroflexota bacterium]
MKSKAVATTSSTIGKYFPSVSPFVYYTMPGTTVGFNGSGFVPGETITIMNGATVVGTVVADSFGKITNAGNVLVPLDAAGTTQTYSLIGETSRGMGSASIQIGSYSPQVSPSSYYATPGSTVTFTGSGYAPGEIVTIFKGNKAVGAFTVGADGSFKNAGGIMVAYNQANTSASYILLGSISKTPQMISFGVGTLSTQVTPSSYYVLPFEVFSVSVSGFAPNEIVNLMSGTSILATATTDKNGNATFTSVSLPAGASSAQLLIIGMTSQATGSVGIGIGNYYASVGASDYYVKPGTEITLSGNGFAANEEITITAGTYSVKTTADKNGAFSLLFTVPFGSTKGSIDITATGSRSTAVSTTTLTLAPYTPTVSPSTYYATPGSDVVFTGSGYIPGETVSIVFQGQVRGTETADSKGNFVSKVYTLPYGKIADYILISNLSDVSLNVNVGLADFYAGVQLDSYYGVGGSIVTVTGSGYAANEAVTIKAGSIVLGVAQADKNGAFTLKVTVPYAKAGELIITAIGDDSDARSTTGYTVAQSYTATQLETYAVEAGAPVTVIGSGYFAGEPITITNKLGTASVTVYAAADGTISNSSFIIPASTVPGEMTLVILGAYSHTVSEITIYVLPSRRDI